VEKHVNVLGILCIAYNAVGVVTGLLAFFALFGVGVLAGVSATYCNPAVDAFPILITIGFLVLGILVFFSIPGIVAGIGLLKFQSWARILGLVLSAVYLLEVPLGTALGVYGLWVLFNQETAKLFSARPGSETAAPPPQ
jgi:hypothetical protein